MKVLSIVNRRGGAGKTATAHALGAGLIRKGYRVLYVDMDSQCNLTYDLGAAAAAPGSREVLIGEATISRAIRKTPAGDIIPATSRLGDADAVIPESRRQYRLRDALASLGKSYDFAIVDTPPALGVLTANALTAADAVIIPAQAEIHSLQGIDLLNQSIGTIREMTTNKKIKIAGILVTRYNGRAILSRDMLLNLKDLADDIGTRVFETPIRECIAVKEAQAMQQDIFSYAPRSNAAKDYAAFIDELLPIVTND